MLKAFVESLHSNNCSSFLVRSFHEKAFSAPYHFHPDLKLTLILRGEGKRFVGSNMSAYQAMMIFLNPFAFINSFLVLLNGSQTTRRLFYGL